MTEMIRFKERLVLLFNIPRSKLSLLGSRKGDDEQHLVLEITKFMRTMIHLQCYKDVTRPYHKASSSIQTVDVYSTEILELIATTQVRILCSCPCVSGRGFVRR